MVHQKELQLQTKGHGDLKDITSDVQRIVAGSGVQCGIVDVFNIGSTAAVGTIEVEPGLEKDLPQMLNRLIPPGRNYGHEAAWHDGNAHSHLQASLMGPSLTVPVHEGRLVLGTWQQIVFVDFDVRPRNRQVILQAVGDE